MEAKDYKKALNKLERLEAKAPEGRNALRDFIVRARCVTKYLNPRTLSEDITYHGYLVCDHAQLMRSRKLTKAEKKLADDAYNVYWEFAEQHYDEIGEQGE